jgi:hypothetical protein
LDVWTAFSFTFILLQSNNANAGEDDEDVEDSSFHPGNAFQGQMLRCKLFTGMVESNANNDVGWKALDMAIEQLRR